MTFGGLPPNDGREDARVAHKGTVPPRRAQSTNTWARAEPPEASMTSTET